MTTRVPNREVVTRFVRDRESGLTGGGAVESRDGALYSYRAKIAEWENGTLVVYAGWDGHSPTTSKHFYFVYDACVENAHMAQHKGETPVPAVPVRVSFDTGDTNRKPRWVKLANEVGD